MLLFLRRSKQYAISSIHTGIVAMHEASCEFSLIKDNSAILYEDTVVCITYIRHSFPIKSSYKRFVNQNPN